MYAVNCISILQMLSSCHRMLVVSASACALLQVHLLFLLLLLELPLPVAHMSPPLLKVPHAAIVGIKPSLFVVYSLFVLGCYPIALLVLSWPECFQVCCCHCCCPATMKNPTLLMYTRAFLCVGLHCVEV